MIVVLNHEKFRVFQWVTEYPVVVLGVKRVSPFQIFLRYYRTPCETSLNSILLLRTWVKVIRIQPDFHWCNVLLLHPFVFLNS